MEEKNGSYEFEHHYVRNLNLEDLDAIVRIERKMSGQPRHDYYQQKLKSALGNGGIRISLAVENDGFVVGFMMGQVFYGEFGQVDPVAIIDSIGVDPDYRGKHIARAMVYQLKTNLRGLGIQRVQTQVDWNQGDLIQFFAKEGFQPAPRLCLECSL